MEELKMYLHKETGLFKFEATAGFVTAVDSKNERCHVFLFSAMYY